MEENKRDVVAKLSDFLLLSQTVPSLLYLFYEEEEEDEYVVVIYRTGEKKKICVTCDSPLQLVRDVVNGI